MTNQCAIGDDCRCVACGARVTARNVLRNCHPVSFPPEVLDSVSGQNSAGPGTQLKLLLAKIGITASPDCKCNSRAAYMDAKGCDWCESEEGMAEIMEFLREAAEERGLPFLDVAGRMLVRRAIANARRNA